MPLADSQAEVADRVRPWVVWLVLGLSTAVAAALRFPFLGHASLWFDEIYTRSVLAESSIAGVWRHVQQTESTPPLYYLIGWLVGAHSAAAMRAIPASALTAAVPVTYLAFRRPLSQPAALAAAVIVAVSPMLVIYSTDARSYGLLVFTGLLSVWGFTAVLERPSRGRYVLWALACVACIWTHYFGGFLVLAEGAILLWRRRSERLATLGWLLAVAICTAPLVPLVSSQANSERAAFIEAESLSNRVLMTIRQFGMGSNVPRAWLEGAGLALWCLAVGFGALVAIRRGGGTRLLLLLAAISVGLPLLLSVTGIEDRFYARNVIVAVPIVGALAAPTMLKMRGAPLVVYVTLALLASVWVATNWRYQQADWRDAISRVEAADSSAPVIAVTQLSAPVASVYLQRGASSPAGVITKSAWIVVEPIRGAHDRALAPAPVPSIPGFRAVRTLSSHAFQLILVQASVPIRIASGIVPNSTVFPGRA